MTIRFISLCFLTLIAIAVFQNCGKSGFQADSFDLPSDNFSLIAEMIRNKSLLTAKDSGIFDKNCLSSSQADACVFWKNPVAQRQAPYSTILEFETNLDPDQNFAVKLANLETPDHLTSKALNVYFSGSNINQRVQLALHQGQFRQSYRDDGGASSTSDQSKSTAQLMAYFWLNYLQTQLKTRTGVSYSENFMTNVDAYAADPSVGSALKDNAFFTYSLSPSARSVVLGYSSKMANRQVVQAHEMALSAEVYLHEMGHANLYAAKGNDPAAVSADENGRTHYLIESCPADPSYQSDISKNFGVVGDQQMAQLQAYCDPKNTNRFKYSTYTVCQTKDGCFHAINEGQADFHYMMMFPEATALGETIYNNSSGGYNAEPKKTRIALGGTSYQCAEGLAAPVVKRNAALDTSLTVLEIFEGSSLQFNHCATEISGEIHGMGSAYASLLWQIYTNPLIHQRLFEKAFQAHLQKLTSSTTFVDAWLALRADYLSVGGDTAGQALIDQAFLSRGLQKPSSF